MKRFIQRFGVILIIAVMIFLFLYNALSKETLTVYDTDTGTSIYTVTTEEETKAPIESVTYQNDTISMTMEIPGEWEYVLKDGYDTYVHIASASSIQIQVLSYYPMVNSASAESLSQTYGSYGYTVTEFSFLANNAYYVVYQSYTASGVIDYIEWVVWDRQHVVKIVVCVNDGNYEKLSDEIWMALNSFSWTYEDPIDSNLFLSYQNWGDFEFAVPTDWIIAATDDSYYAYDSSTGADLTVYVVEDTLNAYEIEQEDYINYISNGLDGFVLTQLKQESNYVYGEGTYYISGMQCGIMQAYITNGTYHYIISWVFPMEYSDYYANLAYTALKLTRIFYVTETENEQETEALTKESESKNSTESENDTGENFLNSSDPVFIPNGFGTEETDNMENADDVESSVYNGSYNQDEEVSSFADALITVAGITAEQANQINYVWTYYIGTSPVYAEAYMMTDISLIVYVQDDYGTDFFIYVSLATGDLQAIYAYAVDGELVYSQ